LKLENWLLTVDQEREKRKKEISELIKINKTVAKTAKALGITRQALNKYLLVNGGKIKRTVEAEVIWEEKK